MKKLISAIVATLLMISLLGMALAAEESAGSKRIANVDRIRDGAANVHAEFNYDGDCAVPSNIHEVYARDGSEYDYNQTVQDGKVVHVEQVGAFPQTSEYTFDDNGSLVGYKAINGDGSLLREETYSYDADKRTKTTGIWNGNGSVNYETEYQYDGNILKNELYYEGGTLEYTTEYIYDEDGVLLSSSRSEDGQVTKTCDYSFFGTNVRAEWDHNTLSLYISDEAGTDYYYSALFAQTEPTFTVDEEGNLLKAVVDDNNYFELTYSD